MDIFPVLCCRNSPLIVSPSSFATRLRFLKEIFPVWSSSNRLKTFWMSSRVSLSLFWNNFIGVVVSSCGSNWLECGSLPFWLSSYQETHRSQCCRCHPCRCRQSFDRWSGSWLQSPKTALLLSTPWDQSYPSHLYRRDWKLHEFLQFLLRLSPVFRMTSRIFSQFASNSSLTIYVRKVNLEWSSTLEQEILPHHDSVDSA